MAQRYLVLDSDPNDESFRWSLDSLLQGWLKDIGFEYRYQENMAKDLKRDVWEGKDTQAILSLVADLSTPSHYILIESGSIELTNQIAEQLLSLKMIPVLSLQKLQDMAEDGSNPGDIARMAQATDPRNIDERSIDIIMTAFKHEQPLVRYRAAQAAGLALVPEFAAELKKLAEDDPDESVRSIASAAASLYN